VNIINFADLHIINESDDSLLRFKYILSNKSFDVVVIAGDVCDNKNINIYELLGYITDKPIIFCLGNHEFSYRSVETTLNTYRQLYNPQKWNVHCLDICNHYDVDNVRFIGNVLWYDGSMKDMKNQSNKFILPSWLDSKIENFDFKNENQNCIKQIKNNFNPNMINYLVTHCVPDISLNVHSEYPSYYNMYSGVDHLLNKFENENIHFNYSISGHTHRFANKEINNTFCVNIGNDYALNSNEMKYFIFNI